MTRSQYLRLGTLLSLMAAAIIEAILLLLLLGASPYSLFSPPAVYLMGLLLVIGVAVYRAYLNGTIHARTYMGSVSPLALLVASTAIMAGWYGYSWAVVLVSAAYFVEEVVGLKLMRDFEEYDVEGARLFAAGMTLFVFTLPLVVVTSYITILTLLGNTVKALGLAKVLESTSTAFRTGERLEVGQGRAPLMLEEGRG